VPNSARNQIFLSDFYWNPLSIDDHGIAALHDEHVFVEVVRMSCGLRGFPAGPERHLAPVSTLEDITFNARSRLIGPSDPVRRITHEFREFVHRSTP
jgi:hypothetical protein